VEDRQDGLDRVEGHGHGEVAEHRLRPAFVGVGDDRPVAEAVGQLERRLGDLAHAGLADALAVQVGEELRLRVAGDRAERAADLAELAQPAHEPRRRVAELVLRRLLDVRAPHVREADEAVLIGPPPSSESYLRGDKIIEAAKQTGAEGIHPGYGFLAERSDFARACEDAGLSFVGPCSEHIALMGDKARAREAARDCDVPTIPGSDGAVDDVDAAVAVATEIGYPVALKAAGGGGGRGIRESS